MLYIIIYYIFKKNVVSGGFYRTRGSEKGVHQTAWPITTRYMGFSQKNDPSSVFCVFGPLNFPL